MQANSNQVLKAGHTDPMRVAESACVYVLLSLVKRTWESIVETSGADAGELAGTELMARRPNTPTGRAATGRASERHRVARMCRDSDFYSQPWAGRKLRHAGLAFSF